MDYPTTLHVEQMELRFGGETTSRLVSRFTFCSDDVALVFDNLSKRVSFKMH